MLDTPANGSPTGHAPIQEEEGYASGDSDSSEPPEGTFPAVHTRIINPKSLPPANLYGSFDENTHEWTDGVLALTVRSASKWVGEDRWWTVFDGPVDAVWIENMNTVLDDNKKLCLSSGEIIRLTKFMTMMFEVDSLSQASPATVSRCGMVYLQTDQVGWRTLTLSWTQRQSPHLQQHAPLFAALFELVLARLYSEASKGHIQTPVPVPPNAHVSAFLSLLDALLMAYMPAPADATPTNRDKAPSGETKAANPASSPSSDSEGGTPKPKVAIPKPSPGGSSTGGSTRRYTPRELAAAEAKLEAVVVFAALWSFGGAATVQGRKVVEAAIRSAVGSGELVVKPLDEAVASSPVASPGFAATNPTATYRRPLTVSLPKGSSIFDMQYDFASDSWGPWLARASRMTIPADAPYSSIIVPTQEMARTKRVVRVLVDAGRHPLLVGQTGTGKTAMIAGSLLKELVATGNYTTQPLQFSAQTEAPKVQDIIIGKLRKRRQGVLAPPLGLKSVLFVDDLNMPEPEIYGAQPPVELLRQWMDHGGWYDRVKGMPFKKVIDVQFVAAMAPPGGGRHDVTTRLTRHFNLLSVLPLDEDSMRAVFTTIMEHFFAEANMAVRSALSGVVSATVKLYQTVTTDLLPTPAKSHYTFSLRDLSKVFQGMAQADLPSLTTSASLLRLWLHESQRVFQDRLIDQGDRAWFVDVQHRLVDGELRESWPELVGEVDAADVADGKADEGAGGASSILFGEYNDLDLPAEMRRYAQMTDTAAVRKAMEGVLQEYNATAGRGRPPMPLVLFDMARRHCARISRCIRQPQGHALLVGVGGSGRRSLTRLATYMAEYTLFQVEVTKQYSVSDWRQDLKSVLRLAGVEGKHVCFMLADTEVVRHVLGVSMGIALGTVLTRVVCDARCMKLSWKTSTAC